MKKLSLSLALFHALGVGNVDATTLLPPVDADFDNITAIRQSGQKVIENVRESLKAQRGIVKENSDPCAATLVESQDHLFDQIFYYGKNGTKIADIYDPKKIALIIDPEYIPNEVQSLYGFSFVGHKNNLISVQALIERIDEVARFIQSASFSAKRLFLSFEHLSLEQDTLDLVLLNHSFARLLNSSSASLQVSMRTADLSYAPPFLAALTPHAHRLEKIWIGQSIESQLPREGVASVQGLLQKASQLRSASLKFHYDLEESDGQQWSKTFERVFSRNHIETIELPLHFSKTWSTEQNHPMTALICSIIKMEGENLFTAYREEDLDSAQVFGVFMGKSPEDQRRHAVWNFCEREELTIEEAVYRYLSSSMIRLCHQRYIDTLRK